MRSKPFAIRHPKRVFESIIKNADPKKQIQKPSGPAVFIHRINPLKKP